MKINPSIAANYFLKKGLQEGIPITIMKLLKLTYIAHGWTLAILDDDEGVLGEEKVEAWRHGPVISSLYHEFKHFQNLPIQDCWSQTTIDESDSGFDLKSVFIDHSDLEDKEKILEIFNFVWNSYKEYSAWGLSQITHESGSPWEAIYRNNKRGLIIPNSLIKIYYKDYLQQMVDGHD